MTKLKFEELNLSEEILSAVKDMGFEEASPIQAEAIPLIMQGKDIIGQAQTGTGKTAAFAIPVIEKIDTTSKVIQALILCPTRELVIQVAEEFRKLTKYKNNITIVPVYGGQQIERQLMTLRKGAQIVIGTPGRLMDHMRRGSIKTNDVATVILDEADEMLDMGFRDDMEVILKDTREDRQTVLFSATMAKDILDITKKYQKSPQIINVTHKSQSAPKIQQLYLEVQEKNKPEVLARLIDFYSVKLALVFCNTKAQVDQLVEVLKTRGYFADALHGDMSQGQRDKVMNGFRNGAVEILVATDVAGRGIDVNDVEAVFNYDLPRDDEDYTHRIGRTARAGKTGRAFTFIVGKQIYNLKRIERASGTLIQRQNIPTIDELEATKMNEFATQVSEIIEAGHLSKYVNQIELLMGEDFTSLDVAAALLKLTIEKKNESFDHKADFSLSTPEPRPERKRFSSDKGFGGRKSGGRDNFRKSSSGRSFRRDDKPSFKRPGGNDSDRPSFKRPSGNDSDKPSFKRPGGSDSDRPSFKRPGGNDSNRTSFKRSSGSDSDRPKSSSERYGKSNDDKKKYSNKFSGKNKD